MEESPPPDTCARRVHDQAQNLASDLRRFLRDWPYFSALQQFELIISNDRLELLNRLTIELERNHVAQATLILGDQHWLARLVKLQGSIPHIEPVAQLLRELSPRTQTLREQCQRLLNADKSWSPEFQNCLLMAINALQNFVQAMGLRREYVCCKQNWRGINKCLRRA